MVGIKSAGNIGFCDHNVAAESLLSVQIYGWQDESSKSTRLWHDPARVVGHGSLSEQKWHPTVVSPVSDRKTLAINIAMEVVPAYLFCRLATVDEDCPSVARLAQW